MGEGCWRFPKCLEGCSATLLPKEASACLYTFYTWWGCFTYPRSEGPEHMISLYVAGAPLGEQCILIQRGRLEYLKQLWWSREQLFRVPVPFAARTRAARSANV